MEIAEPDRKRNGLVAGELFRKRGLDLTGVMEDHRIKARPIPALFRVGLLVGALLGLPSGFGRSQATVIPDMRVAPVNEAVKNQGFKRFHDEMLAAADRHDVNYLIRHLDQEILYSFGDDTPGVEGFLHQWRLDSTPARSEFWAQISRIMRMGGTFDDAGQTSYTTPFPNRSRRRGVHHE